MAIQEGTELLPGNTEVTNVAPQGNQGEKKFKEIFEKANVKANSVCPVRDIIARISDKWSILAILALGGHGTLRFNELKNVIGDVSQRMLTVTLKNLESDGLVTRKVYPQIPPRVEYDLTPLGYELMHQYSVFAEWASDNEATILAARKKSRVS